MSVAAKICGLSSEEAVAAAIAGGAAYVGFVFYPPSPRSVSPRRAGELCRAVPAGVQRVGLFVDADDAVIEAALDAAPLEHNAIPRRRDPRAGRRGKAPLRPQGDERRFRSPAPRTSRSPRVTKAPPTCCYSTPSRRAAPMRCPAATVWCSTGSSSPARIWRLPWMLSGGLTAELLPEAVRISGAQAVDVSSGVETSPGRKDVAKIRAFLAAAAAIR